MNITLSAISRSKLESVCAAERRTIRGVLARIRCEGMPDALPISKLPHAVQLQVSDDGPLLLFQGTENGRSAILMGFLTAQQRCVAQAT